MLKSEFQLKNIKLGYNEPYQFYAMQLWCLPSSVIWWFRVLCTNYAIASMVYSIIYANEPKWVVFLTNWTVLLITVYFLSITVISGIYGYDYQLPNGQDVGEIELSPSHVEEDRIKETKEEKMSFYLKFLWVWFNITYVISMVTYVMYWAFVYEDNHLHESTRKTFLYFNEHFVLLFLCFIDLSFHKIPVRLYHVVYSIIVTILYLLMSVIYDFASNDYIYKILDWENKAGWTIFYFFLAIVMEFVSQLILYAIYRLKLKYKQ